MTACDNRRAPRGSVRAGRGVVALCMAVHAQPGGAHMRIRSSRAAGSSEAGGGASGGMLPCKRRGSKGSAARLNSAALAHVHAMAMRIWGPEAERRAARARPETRGRRDSQHTRAPRTCVVL